MRFIKKPVVVEAITFEEFIAYGREHANSLMNGVPWSFSYKGHPVTHENDECYLIPTLEGTHNFTPNDMLITGVKGEIYPCKRDIFEATYALVEQTDRMSFSEALVMLKVGKKLTRAGWNGKGMWLEYFKPEQGVDLPYLRLMYPVNSAAYPQGARVPWLASQTDSLAEDWMVVQ